ncbi:hypothetical protein AbraIFM66950_010865 [Aspergillus brasiliensis]|nr:hypothetical protein AbraIFM66950_010865 [Aspergillus brasiliensis]
MGSDYKITLSNADDTRRTFSILKQPPSEEFTPLFWTKVILEPGQQKVFYLFDRQNYPWASSIWSKTDLSKPGNPILDPDEPQQFQIAKLGPGQSKGSTFSVTFAGNGTSFEETDTAADQNTFQIYVKSRDSSENLDLIGIGGDNLPEGGVTPTAVIPATAGKTYKIKPVPKFYFVIGDYEPRTVVDLKKLPEGTTAVDFSAGEGLTNRDASITCGPNGFQEVAYWRLSEN